MSNQKVNEVEESMREAYMDPPEAAERVSGQERCYYILDIRSVVGNCACWWRPNGQGYTCNIDDAGLYTLAETRGRRDTDVPLHKDVVEPLIVRHVRLDVLRQNDVLAEHERKIAAKDKPSRRRSKR